MIDGDKRLTYAELVRPDRPASAAGCASSASAAAIGSPGWRSTRSVTSRRGSAIPTANLIFNDLNFRLALAELEFIVNDSGARVLSPTRATGRPPSPCSSAATALEQLVWMDDGASPDGSATWDELAARRSVEPPRRPRRRLRRRHHLHRWHDRAAEGRDADPRQPDGQRQAHAVGQPAVRDDRFLHLTPMFHSAGVANMYAQTLVAGTHITCPGFDPDLVGRMIERYEVSVCVLVPTMINMFLNHPGTAERDLSTWRLCLYAASPIPMALLQRAMDELPCGFSQGYGMTEMSPALLPAHDRGPRQGDGRRPRRRAAAGQRRHAVHRRRRRDPPPGRQPVRRSARWARSRCAGRT